MKTLLATLGITFGILFPSFLLAQENVWQLIRENASNETIQSALEEGADPNEIGTNGSTPLHHSSVYGDFELTSLLLDYGANPNQSDPLGLTPLHWAIQSQTIEIVELLFDFGAEPNIVNNEGLSALDLALLGQNGDIIQMIVSKGGVSRLGHFEFWNSCGPVSYKVEALPSVADSIGLNEGEIDEFVYLLLATNDLYRESAQWPYLAVNIQLEQRNQIYYSINIDFTKLGIIARSDNRGLFPAFSLNRTGLVESGEAKEFILRDLAQLLEQMIATYLTVNAPVC